MDKTTTVSTTIKHQDFQDASQQAKIMGFKSLEAAIQFFILKLSQKVSTISKVKEPAPEYVTLTARAKKRYNKIENDFKEGKNFKSFNSIDDMLGYLSNTSNK